MIIGQQSPSSSKPASVAAIVTKISPVDLVTNPFAMIPLRFPVNLANATGNIRMQQKRGMSLP
jgi:hypothetical protein